MEVSRSGFVLRLAFAGLGLDLGLLRSWSRKEVVSVSEGLVSVLVSVLDGQISVLSRSRTLRPRLHHWVALWSILVWLF